MVNFARAMCKGDEFPPIEIIHGAKFDTIADGHHRFVASKLAKKPIAIITIHDISSSGLNWPRSFEWTSVKWN